MDDVKVEHPSAGVALLRIDRPQARNALSEPVRRALVEHLAAFAADPEVRVAVLTGSRDIFAAGADLTELANLGSADMMERREHGYWDAIAAFPKPLIAAVEGSALGGGCELAMHADIVVVGETARIGQPEVRVGIMPGGGGTQRLPRLVGKHRAMLMLLTGRPVSGSEAVAMGLASRAVPDGGALDEALAIARAVAVLPPIALAAIKKTVLAGLDRPLDEGLALERRAVAELFDTADQKEGMRAFLDKRPPRFEGR